MRDFLSETEVRELTEKIKNGDNAAWEKVCDNFERYIHERVWSRLRKFNMIDDYQKNLKEDLYMAGWQGFVSAIRNYDPEKGKLLTYATYYIDGEISKELDLLLNPLGLTNRPKPTKNSTEGTYVTKVSLDECPDQIRSLDLIEEGFNIENAPERESYSAERRALQILEVLKLLTDEDHSISKDELYRRLKLYRIAKYDNSKLEDDRTLTSTLDSILQELDPLEYKGENDAEYKIRYEGYKEDRLKKNLNKEKGKKAASITGFSYVHTYDNEELDKNIQLLCFSDMLSLEEKTSFIGKMIGTASTYYRSPFWDGEKIRFNSKAIHGRFAGRGQEEKKSLSGNLKVIQQAVNSMGQIRFKFNRFTAEHILIPKTEYLHTLSPYHLVVYHDNYYCIGLKCCLAH